MARGEQRGPYAKGVARRAEILRVALEEYGKADRQGASLKQIADSVGLTEAGVLHYFDSKDDMLL
ncbi:MAG TPA: helix-turn-helix domain-containing protein, partial [Jatrophihabitantaceae bacterium]|nr:helix-turn-helix domain-containing protein [Jatrophihabitantaceae bacterium]